MKTIYVSKFNGKCFPRTPDNRSVDVERQVYPDLKEYKKINENEIYEIFELLPAHTIKALNAGR